jgi:hypothetical protein
MFRMERDRVLLPYQFGNLTIWVIQIPENPRLVGTGVHTGRRGLSILTRLQSLTGALIDSLLAKIALCDYTFLMGVQFFPNLLIRGQALPWKIFLPVLRDIGAHLIRTRNETISAAHTFVRVDLDNTIFPLLRRTRGTDLHTCGIFAVIAKHRIHVLFDVGICAFPFRDQQSPPHDARRQEMLLLAFYGTAVTSSALNEIDQHSPSHCSVLLFTV